MSVTVDTVKKVARLARIEVSEAEAATMTDELSSILQWVEQLSSVDVSNVEPMTSVIDMPIRQRDDMVNDGEIPERVFSNAPAEDDHFFMVPKVIE